MKTAKLLSGKLWNKVVRLSATSEFNIETTSAIAGVRGTEFGASADDVFVVRSDQVVVFDKLRKNLLRTGGFYFAEIPEKEEFVEKI